MSERATIHDRLDEIHRGVAERTAAARKAKRDRAAAEIASRPEPSSVLGLHGRDRLLAEASDGAFETVDELMWFPPVIDEKNREQWEWAKPVLLATDRVCEEAARLVEENPDDERLVLLRAFVAAWEGEMR